MGRKLRYNEEEGGMAKAQLQKIEMYAAKLNEMIHPDDELEGWVQNKLSVVAAYMGDVKHYLDYALQNEPEYKEFANGGMTDKPRYWEVEFTWSAADEESRKVNVMAESVSDAEEQVRKKFGPYYEGLKVVEVEEDKEISWEEYAKRPKKFEVESTTDYDVIEANDEEEAKKEWMRRRKGDSYKSEILKVRRKFADGGEIEVGDKVIYKNAKYHATVERVIYDVEIPYAEIRYSDGKKAKAYLEDLQKVELRMAKEYVNPNYMAEGGMVYDIEWRDEEGDTYSASFDSLEEAKEEIKKIREEGGRVTETWKYRDGEFVGRFDSGGMMREKYFSVSWFDPRNGTKHKQFSSKEDAIKYVVNLYKYEDYLEYANKEEIPAIYDENRKEVMSGYELQHLAEKQINKMASGGTMRYEGSTMEEDMKEAEEYIGKEVWDTLSAEDKDNATKYLRAKGVIGFQGQEEELADFMASQYGEGGDIDETKNAFGLLSFEQLEKIFGEDLFGLEFEEEERKLDELKKEWLEMSKEDREEILQENQVIYAKGGTLYRGMRPSPSISATAYPKGFKMIGNDGNLWEISVDSRGVHRWTKSQSSTRDERMQQKAKIREAIELLESLRDEVDVEDELKTLKKLQ